MQLKPDTIDNYYHNDAVYFEQDLKKAIKHNTNWDMRNGAPLRAKVAHKVFFDIMETALVFSRGFHRDIFDSPLVLKSFEKKINTLAPDTQEPIMQIIIKETKDKINKYMDASKFCRKIKDLSDKHNKELVKISYIDPNQEIKLDSSIRIDGDIIEPKLSITNNKYNGYVKDINTFEIFNDSIIRVRTGFDDDKNSSAIINCGLDPIIIQNIRINIFDALKKESIKL